MEDLETPFDDHALASSFEPPAGEAPSEDSRVIHGFDGWIPDERTKKFLLDVQRSWLHDYRQSLEKASVELLDEMQAAADRQLAAIRRQQTTEFRRQLLALREEADEKFQQDFIIGLQKQEQEFEEFKRAIKSKQWCTTCLKEAFYYCCWNCQYCSPACQKEDWKNHKFRCRRPPADSS